MAEPGADATRVAELVRAYLAGLRAGIASAYVNIGADLAAAGETADAMVDLAQRDPAVMWQIERAALGQDAETIAVRVP